MWLCHVANSIDMLICGQEHILQHLEEVIEAWKLESSQRAEHQRFTNAERDGHYALPSKM
jgi:hypothetical protein